MPHTPAGAGCEGEAASPWLTIRSFIFGKDGNIYAVLAVDDLTGLGGHLIAIPFRSLKPDDPAGYIILPGASRASLQKLPVFVSNR